MKRSANEAEVDAGRVQRSANLVQLFNLTGTDRVANLVRRADRRRQSAGWRKTVQNKTECRPHSRLAVDQNLAT
jgi:hypothetical protein